MRIIGHLDMDAFFASIEERDKPHLRGLPIVVGADPEEGHGRGVVSTANYAAREYGIRSAMPITTAWRLSEMARLKGLPAAIFLTGMMGKYGAESEKIMAILRRYAEHVEEASVDEAYFDLTPSGSYEAAAELCKKLKAEIRSSENLTASIGIGPNKLIAKIASDRQKPDGLTVVRGEDAEKFLEPLGLRTIPGVGPKAEERFKKLRAFTVRDAKQFSREELTEMMGKWGTELYERLRAQDETPLIEEWKAKSIGEQETFTKDTLDATFLNDHLYALAASIYESFIHSGFKTFHIVTITVRFADFKTFTRGTTLREPDHRLGTLKFEAARLFMPFLDKRENPDRKFIRLVGVRIERLK